MREETLKKLRMMAHMNTDIPSSLAPVVLKNFPVDTPILDAYIAGLFVIRALWIENDALDEETLLDYEAYTDGFIQKVGMDMGMPIGVIDDLKLSVSKGGDKLDLLDKDVAGLLKETTLDKTKKSTLVDRKFFSLAFAFVRDVLTIVDFKNLHPKMVASFVNEVAGIVGLDDSEKKKLQEVL